MWKLISSGTQSFLFTIGCGNLPLLYRFLYISVVLSVLFYHMDLLKISHETFMLLEPWLS